MSVNSNDYSFSKGNKIKAKVCSAAWKSITSGERYTCTFYTPICIVFVVVSFFTPFVAVRARFPQGKSLPTKTCIILNGTRQLFCMSKFISGK